MEVVVPTPTPTPTTNPNRLLYTQTEISRAPRRVAGAFGSRTLVGLDKPRISPDALRLGTAAAPIVEL